MRDPESCRRRAAEYEAEAQLVPPGANRRRYLHLAACWRELAEQAEVKAERRAA
jgi:hypothetical protein